MEELPISLISAFSGMGNKFTRGFQEARIDYKDLEVVGTPANYRLSAGRRRKAEPCS